MDQCVRDPCTRRVRDSQANGAQPACIGTAAKGAPRRAAAWGERVQRVAQTGAPFPRTVAGLRGGAGHR